MWLRYYRFMQETTLFFRLEKQTKNIINSITKSHLISKKIYYIENTYNKGKIMKLFIFLPSALLYSVSYAKNIPLENISSPGGS